MHRKRDIGNVANSRSSDRAVRKIAHISMGSLEVAECMDGICGMLVVLVSNINDYQ